MLEVEFDKIRVDLGRWHGVQPGQRFQVYRGEGSGLQIAAMLEVTRVEERTSWCRDLGPRRLVDGVHSRIVDVPGSKAPVEPGCGVRSPFFETHERQVFVLLGARPWGHSRERLAELLADSGVSVREQVGSDTDFVVILDGLSGSDLDELRLARRFGVTLITQRELLDYLP